MDFTTVVICLSITARHLERREIERGTRGNKNARNYYKGMADAYDKILDVIDIKMSLDEGIQIDESKFENFFNKLKDSKEDK